MCGFYSTAVLKGKIVLPTMLTSFSLPCYTQARNLLSRTERCLCAAVGGSALMAGRFLFCVFPCHKSFSPTDVPALSCVIMQIQDLSSRRITLKLQMKAAFYCVPTGPLSAIWNLFNLIPLFHSTDTVLLPVLVCFCFWFSMCLKRRTSMSERLPGSAIRPMIINCIFILARLWGGGCARHSSHGHLLVYHGKVSKSPARARCNMP